MTEFGSLALVERDDGVSNASLPGTHKGDLSERNFKPEVRVTQVAFSPTGREFAACSTEGEDRKASLYNHVRESIGSCSLTLFLCKFYLFRLRKYLT